MKAKTHVFQNKHPSLRILKEGGEEVRGRAPLSSNMYNSKVIIYVKHAASDVRLSSR
jgi:hypothetical protein